LPIGHILDKLTNDIGEGGMNVMLDKQKLPVIQSDVQIEIRQRITLDYDLMSSICIPILLRFVWFILLLTCLLSGCKVHEPVDFDDMVKVGTHRLHIRCQGKGSPVIVVETGSGVSSSKFLSLQQELAKTTRVCLYDRAGYAPSDIGLMPRDAGREVDELHALLVAVNVRGPYVFVGHSLGALNVQVYASRYPKEIAGVVLMDPPPLDWLLGKKFTGLREVALAQTKEWQSMADQADASPEEKDQQAAIFLKTIASELQEMFGETARLLDSIDTFGNIPLVVIASEKANPQFGEEAEAYQKFWIDQSRLLSQRSSHGNFILAKDSSHLIYEDNPDLVLSTIQAVISGEEPPH
jgi:pimeloyl-ACP methyl ester carboxylesterase